MKSLLIAAMVAVSFGVASTAEAGIFRCRSSCRVVRCQPVRYCQPVHWQRVVTCPTYTYTTGVVVKSVHTLPAAPMESAPASPAAVSEPLPPEPSKNLPEAPAAPKT